MRFARKNSKGLNTYYQRLHVTVIFHTQNRYSLFLLIHLCESYPFCGHILKIAALCEVLKYLIFSAFYQRRPD